MGRVVRHRMLAYPHVHARLDTIRSWSSSKRRGGSSLPFEIVVAGFVISCAHVDLKSLIRKSIITGAAAVCLTMSHPKEVDRDSRSDSLNRIRAADKSERKQNLLHCHRLSNRYISLHLFMLSAASRKAKLTLPVTCFRIRTF